MASFAAETPASPSTPDHPHPIQIVSVGGANDGYSFTLQESALNEILSRSPPTLKVAVVSVVGAFRTGKSFVLSWFLRYLKEHAVTIKEDGTSSPAVPADLKWFEKGGSLNEGDKFDWRGGSDRHTTGIWMWSHPFTLKITNGELVSLLLVDTQGMFDHETTMGLTAAIFGLSTLLSSYQVYNVSGRIQEDNLQQLALFSEYGRMALESGEGEAASDAADAVYSDDDSEEVKSIQAKIDMKRKERKEKAVVASADKPFQRMEFLVRDWQNFDDEDCTDLDATEKEMDEYLSSVIAERDAKDLAETRTQITSCFEKVSCFLLTHPGFVVTKKKYDGAVEGIEGTFMRLLTRYCDRVFRQDLEPKKIHGRYLTAEELGTYIKSYAKMFKSGAAFPEATTMLAATAEANNRNAVMLALAKYKSEMDFACGPRANVYMNSEEFNEHDSACVDAAIELFENMANFGAKDTIKDAKGEVVKGIRESRDMYKSINDGRNPLAGLETYMIPMSIAVVSFILRWLADLTCSSWSQTCKVSSDVLGQIYSVVFIFLIIVAATRAKQIAEYAKQIKAAIGVISGGGGGLRGNKDKQ